MDASETATAAAARRSAAEWWNATPAVLILAVLSSAPLWFTPLPPLIDLPAHLGRYHVALELAHSPALQRNWDFEWRLAGNLGVDLLVLPLAPIVGLERAVWLIAASLPPLMVLGVARVSRAAHGRVTPFALVALPFAAAFPFQYGFLNYWLGCALALNAFASWARAPAEPPPRLARQLLFAAIAAAIWLVHAYGWAVFVGLVAAFEVQRRWSKAPSQWPRMAWKVLTRTWPVLTPLALMAAWRATPGGGETQGFFQFGLKAIGLAYALRDQNAWLDLASLAFATAALCLGFASRAVRAHPGLGLAALAFVGVVVLMPWRAFGSAFADVRLWPIVFMTALTAMAPVERSWRGAAPLAAAALAVFLARIAAGGLGFAAYERAYSQHLRALDQIPKGASVAIVAATTTCSDWRFERVAHLGSMAIVRKDAFVNSQWDIPGALSLRPLRARGTAFNADPSQYPAYTPCDQPAAPAILRKLQAIPRDRFDYVWALGFDAADLPRTADMSQIFRDQRTALYRLEPRRPAP